MRWIYIYLYISLQIIDRKAPYHFVGIWLYNYTLNRTETDVFLVIIYSYHIFIILQAFKDIRTIMIVFCFFLIFLTFPCGRLHVLESLGHLCLGPRYPGGRLVTFMREIWICSTWDWRGRALWAGFNSILCNHHHFKTLIYVFSKHWSSSSQQTELHHLKTIIYFISRHWSTSSWDTNLHQLKTLIQIISKHLSRSS